MANPSPAQKSAPTTTTPPLTFSQLQHIIDLIQAGAAQDEDAAQLRRLAADLEQDTTELTQLAQSLRNLADRIKTTQEL